MLSFKKTYYIKHDITTETVTAEVRQVGPTLYRATLTSHVDVEIYNLPFCDYISAVKAIQNFANDYVGKPEEDKQ